MKCSKCGTKMEIRTGKFGDFYFCKNNSSNDPHKTLSVRVNSEPEIGVVKFNSGYTFNLDDEIMNDVYSFGFKRDHIGELAQFPLGAASDIHGHVDDYGYCEP